MGEEDQKLKSLTFDVLVNGLYFFILLLSFILLVSIFDNSKKNANYDEFYSTLFVLVATCALDGIKELVKRIHNHQAHEIISVIALVVQVLEICAILFIWATRIPDSIVFCYILIAGCGLCFVKYGFDLGDSIIQFAKEKTLIRKNKKK